MAAGDIHWIEFPPANGREQIGRRPAILLQEDTYTTQLPVVLVVPLTTASKALRFPGTFLVQPSADNGLPKHP
jgi:mRNA interferase MazF